MLVKRQLVPRKCLMLLLLSESDSDSCCIFMSLMTYGSVLYRCHKSLGQDTSTVLLPSRVCNALLSQTHKQLMSMDWGIAMLCKVPPNPNSSVCREKFSVGRVIPGSVSGWE